MTMTDAVRTVYAKSLSYNDARGGSRTRMGLPPRDFKSLVSTDSTTRARTRNVPTRNDLRKFLAHRLYIKGIACRQKCRHFLLIHACFISFRAASTRAAASRSASPLMCRAMASPSCTMYASGACFIYRIVIAAVA